MPLCLAVRRPQCPELTRAQVPIIAAFVSHERRDRAEDCQPDEDDSPGTKCREDAGEKASAKEQGQREDDTINHATAVLTTRKLIEDLVGVLDPSDALAIDVPLKPRQDFGALEADPVDDLLD